MKHLKSYILSLVMLLALVACRGVSEQQTLVVSIPPQQYLLEKLVGDKMKVVCMMEQTANPETFEASMTKLAQVERAKAYFLIGNIGFEQQLTERLADNSNIAFINTSQGISFITEGHSHHHDDGDEDEEHEHEIDPHIWSSPENAVVIADNMLKALVEIDPNNKEFYSANYDALIKEINQVDAEVQKILAPVKGKSFIVWHPSLSYFAKRYGLHQISMEMEGKESSVGAYKKQLDIARSHNASVFLYQKEFDSHQITGICDELGIKMLPINPMNQNWHEEMLSTAHAIAQTK